MTTTNIINFADFKVPKKADPLSVSAGAPIFARSFSQAVGSVEQLHNVALSLSPEFNRFMESTARTLRMEFFNPGVKSAARMAQKAAHDYDHDVTRVLDPLRGSFIGTAPQLARALDYFAHANNSAVLEIKNQFGTPDPENGMARAKIIYAIPTTLTSSGHLLGEIQLRHPSMRDALEETGEICRKLRAIKDGLMNSASTLPHTAVMRLQREQAALQTARIETNLAAAKGTDLHKLVETRTYGMLDDGTPFAAIKIPLREHPQVLRPDAATGTYVVDNSLSVAFNSNAFKPISLQNFVDECQMQVLSYAQEAEQQQPSAMTVRRLG